MTRILIIDDHVLFADMLRELVLILDSAAEVDTSANFASAERALKNGPDYDLVLLDLNMPGLSGMSAFEKLKAINSKTPIAIVSGQARLTDIRNALKAGAAGFLPKTIKSQVFLNALQLMLSGSRYIPDAMLGSDDVEPCDDKSQLTPRETDVFEALMGGRSNTEIAAMLQLSEATVKMHMQHIFQKVGARNRGDAIRIGLQRNHMEIN
jgi:DNA-binding NarL/FixJ family response regulator